tara:strand:+ start:119 stop:616 length:498 start_codon:yes stop_codon:yes gene_type:complete
MKKLIIGLFLMGITTQIYAQDPMQLPEVVIVHNYKYLSSVNSEAEAIPVEQLQMKVSDFNVKELDIYSDEYDLYDVYFIIPEGKVLASYDKENNLLRTVERYKNINLPLPVMESITKRFPNWSVSKNIYLVNYHESGNMRKLYKLTLENGDQRIKVKADDRGIFL